jgi:integrase
VSAEDIAMKKNSKRRGRGEDGVRQLANGTWECQINKGVKSIPDKHNPGQTKTVPDRRYCYGKTKEEALQNLQKLRQELFLERAEHGRDYPLAKLLKDFLTSVKANCDPHTYNQLAWLADKKILPDIGPVKLKDVTQGTIENWRHITIDRGTVSTDAANRCIRLLKQAFRYAVKRDYLSRDPLADMDPPRVDTEPKIHAMDPQERHAFLVQAKAHRLCAFWYLALDSGARMGELLALEWPDLDFETGILFIHKSVKTDEKGGNARVKKPKTKSSIRRLQLSQKTLAALRQWRKKHPGSRLMFPAIRYSNSRHQGERHMMARTVRRTFRRLLKRAGLLDRPGKASFCFHDLRHTCATQLLAQTSRIASIARRLGHRDPSVTLRTYAAWMPTEEQELVACAQQWFEQAEAEPAPHPGSPAAVIPLHSA